MPMRVQSSSKYSVETKARLTISQVATRLQVCEHTIRRMAKRGELPIIRVGQTGRLIRIREEDVEAYENKNLLRK